MPPTLLGVANTMDVVTTRFVALMGSSIMSTDGAGHQFIQRTFLGRFIAWFFWLVVNWIADRHAGYSKSENAQKLRPMPLGYGYAKIYTCLPSLVVLAFIMIAHKFY